MSEIFLFSDGAARGNPGPAGAGVLIVSSSGETLLTRSVYLGETTNNVAEYRALLIGLEAALDLRPDRLCIRMDSELIVRQLNGRYRVRNPGLIPLFQRAVELLKKFRCVEVAHVPREENRSADRLANVAIDTQSP